MLPETLKENVVLNDLPEHMLKELLRYRSKKSNTLSKELLTTLYYGKKLSTYSIATLLNRSHEAVRKWMVKHGIPLRSKSDALMIYSKRPFSGDVKEKSYLIGLRYGDLSAQIARKQVRVLVSTTHPKMLQLFEKLFARYSSVSKYPKYDKRNREYKWQIYTYLHSSFKFLISKEEQIPEQIFENTDQFINFLSGFFDAEGSIKISPNGVYIRHCLSIESSSLGILADIKRKLEELGFHPSLKLKKKAGSKSGFTKCKKDQQVLTLWQKHEAAKLLSMLKLKHPEKKEKRKLFFHTFKKRYWAEIEKKILSFRQKMKEEIRQCIEEARVEWIKRNITTP